MTGLSKSPLLTLAILLAIVKAAEFAIDSTALFFYDSGAFLMNALKLGFMPERSYFYGDLIRVFAVPFHSLRAIVAMQEAMGGISAWLLGYALLRLFKVRTWIAMAAALAFSIDPVQIVHEHLIMAETSAIFAMALFLVAAGLYLEAPKWWRLAIVSALGILMIGFRIVYLPPVLVMAVLLPLAAWPRLGNARGVAIALTVSLSSTLVFQLGYTHLTGWFAGREPAYHYATGFFLVSGVAPIVEAQDASDPRVAQAVIEQNRSGLPLWNRGRRDDQLWDAAGLSVRLRSLFHGDARLANQAALGLGRRAILRNPVGLLKLGLLAYLDYWKNLPILAWALTWENGSAKREIFPWEVGWVQSAFGVDISNAHLLQTPSRRYQILGRYWYVFLLGSPFLAALGLLIRPRTNADLIAALFFVWSILVLTATCLGAVESSYRFLQPLSFTGLAAAAFLAEKNLIAWRGEPRRDP